MYNGMMDPDMIRLAQEQMSRMSPADFARIQQQMMANPDLMRMASASMNNMRPEDLKQAAEQLKYTRPEEMAQIGEKMANASPEEIAAMRAGVDGHITYRLNAAEMLKKQGNELHRQGKFNEALQKYMLAKKNLKEIPSSRGSALLLACSLNLMSCYLKTGQHYECIKEGSEVLASDTKNAKALYRRGQAYKELGQYQNAVSDLSMAHEASPDDETIEDVLRDSRKRLAEEGGENAQKKPVIEEITGEDDTVSMQNSKSSSGECSIPGIQESSVHYKSQSAVTEGGLTNSESLQALKDNPEAIRSFQNFLSKADPETLAAMSAGKAGEISPDLVKTASNMVSNMSRQELQKMLELATSFQGENPYLEGGLSGTNFGSSNVTPDMLKTATDMMSSMSSEDMQKMFEMTSSLKGTEKISEASISGNARGLERQTEVLESRESGVNRSSTTVGETGPSQPSLPRSNFDLQEQMRNQMKDPAMRQMFSSMMKNMSPDMMANMSEQFGLNLSREDAEKAQQAMASLSPEDLDRMMLWANRVQRGVEGAKKTKNWLLGRPGMILAICMLILAIILHRLGFIGS